VKRERDEDGVPGEEIGPGDGVEHLACVIDSPGTRVEGDELGGEEVGWCHGRDDEAGVELAARLPESAQRWIRWPYARGSGGTEVSHAGSFIRSS
jgi:hypothetical protein